MIVSTPALQLCAPYAYVSSLLLISRNGKSSYTPNLLFSLRSIAPKRGTLLHNSLIFLVVYFHLIQLQLLGCLAGVEMVLKDVGYPVKLGSGVAAACAYLQNTVPVIRSRN